MFILTISACSGKDNNLTKSNLKGKVYRLTETRYSAKEKFGEIIKDTLEAEEVLTFNEQGYLVEKLEKGFGRFENRKEIFEYNKDSQVSKKTAFDKNVKIIQTYLFDYDKNKKLVRWQNIDANKKILQYETYKYDQKGLLIESISYNEDGSVLSKSMFTNEDHGNCIEKNFYDGNTTTETHKLKYNQQNQVTQNEMFMYGSTIGKTVYKYHNGELSDEISYPSTFSKDTTTWKYEYIDIDKQGNWLTKTLRWTQGYRFATGMTERKIDYFK